jgi:hypothetical protein
MTFERFAEMLAEGEMLLRSDSSRLMLLFELNSWLLVTSMLDPVQEVQGRECEM